MDYLFLLLELLHNTDIHTHIHMEGQSVWQMLHIK